MRSIKHTTLFDIDSVKGMTIVGLLTHSSVLMGWLRHYRKIWELTSY